MPYRGKYEKSPIARLDHLRLTARSDNNTGGGGSLRRAAALEASRSQRLERALNWNTGWVETEQATTRSTLSGAR